MLFADNIYEIIHMHKYILQCHFPDWFAPFPFCTDQSSPFTYLEIPFLVIVVRMSIHSRPWLVVNCSPLAT
jgi:hypothetical protein